MCCRDVFPLIKAFHVGSRFTIHTDVGGASMCDDIDASNARAEYRTKFYIFGYYLRLP
jgi:hypothetical protein